MGCQLISLILLAGVVLIDVLVFSLGNRQRPNLATLNQLIILIFHHIFLQAGEEVEFFHLVNAHSYGSLLHGGFAICHFLHDLLLRIQISWLLDD